MERLALWCCGIGPETAGSADCSSPLDELLSTCCFAGLQARFLVPSHTRICPWVLPTFRKRRLCLQSAAPHLQDSTCNSCVPMCRDNAAEMRAARASIAHWANARLAAAVSGWRSYIRRHGEMIRRLQATAVKLQQPLQLQAWQSWRHYILQLQARRVRLATPLCTQLLGLRTVLPCTQQFCPQLQDFQCWIIRPAMVQSLHVSPVACKACDEACFDIRD